MLVKYVFADGETSEAEVSEEIGQFILGSRRDEENLARKERYHCLSSDAAEFDGEDYADDKTIESITDTDEFNKEFYKVYNTLTDVQKRRVEMLGAGLSIREIAKIEGRDFKTVHESVMSMRKKFQKFS